MNGPITPCLWFDGDAEAAAQFYVSVFPNSKISHVQRAATDYPGGKAGQAILVQFQLNGQPFQALNGGDFVSFNEAISLSVPCRDQAEVDQYWNALSAVPEAEQCAWLKDKFGVSWQIVPEALPRLLASPDPAVAQRVMKVMMDMKKIIVAELEAAAE